MRNGIDLLRFLAEKSALREDALDRELRSGVYAGVKDWKLFLRVILPGLGLGFLACGIVFFLAYNWAGLPRTGKIGIATASVVVPALLALSGWWKTLVNNGLMTMACFMVGGLFAVLGQIYQTGADAYDLFLAWWLFTIVWVVVVEFSWLWLLSLILLNVTVGLYFDQRAAAWSASTLSGTLMVLNLLALGGFSLYGERWRQRPYPRAMLLTVALGAALAGVSAFLGELFEPRGRGFSYLVLLGVPMLFSGLAVLAYRRRELAYLAIIALSLVAMSAAVVVHFVEESDGFLLASLWALGATIFSSVQLNKQRKIWRHDQG